MATPDAHSLILFSLKPSNDRARRAFLHPDNRHLVSFNANNDPVVNIGLLCLRGTSSTTLVTLGRGNDADIYIEGPTIARIQCSFEFDTDTGITMFYDRSHGCTSQVFGDDPQFVQQFESGRVRKVVVQKDLNPTIGMGDEGCNLLLFDLDWREDSHKTASMMMQYGALPGIRRQHLRAAQTVAEAPTELPFHRET